MKDEDNIDETNDELAASENDESLTDGFDDIVTKSSNHFYENNEYADETITRYRANYKRGLKKQQPSPK